MKKNDVRKKRITSILITSLIVVIGAFALKGIPTGTINKMKKVESVTVTRFVNEKEETTTITREDDQQDKEKNKPFMRFELSKNMINMITYLPIPTENFKPDYTYTFNMKNGKVKEYKISKNFVSINGKCFKQHPKSEYETFKNITNHMYFGDK